MMVDKGCIAGAVPNILASEGPHIRSALADGDEDYACSRQSSGASSSPYTDAGGNIRDWAKVHSPLHEEVLCVLLSGVRRAFEGHKAGHIHLSLYEQVVS